VLISCEVYLKIIAGHLTGCHNIHISECLLGHVIEGKIEVRLEVTERRGRRRKQLLDDLEETRGY